MHRGFVRGDLPTCVIAVPALAVRTFEVARVSWGRIEVRLAEEAGRLDEWERELAEHQGDAEDATGGRSRPPCPSCQDPLQAGAG
jgi:hypothetical protein